MICRGYTTSDTLWLDEGISGELSEISRNYAWAYHMVDGNGDPATLHNDRHSDESCHLTDLPTYAADDERERT